MQVIINARFLTQPITGVQRFAIELSKKLKEQKKINILFVTPKGVVHTELAAFLDAIEIGRFRGHLWEQIDLPIYLKKNGNPLLLSLCSTAPCFYRNQIVTHHDITYIRCPESFSYKFKLLYRFLVPIFLKNSKKIITVSEFSKKEISSFFKIPEDKFIVVYNGVDRNVFHKSDRNDQIKTKYILAVSSQNHHKNFQGLLKAFEEIKNELTNVDLYIVGNSNIRSFNNVKLDINELQLKKRIHFLGRIDDTELVKAYQQASLFIFPSFYEGFGIPPIEAQSCGCPVIASNQASMPEILQDSVLYFDPYSNNDLSEKILYFFNNAETSNQICERGMKNIERFDWEQSAKKILIHLK